MAKTILSEKAVCKWLDISQWKLEDLRKNHEFPYFEVGRELRFYTKQAIEQWVLGCIEYPPS